MWNTAMNWVIGLATNHQQFVGGVVVGGIVTNPGACAIFLFNLLVKIPGVGLWISKNPDKAKGWADSFDKAIDAQIDKYAPKPPNP